MILANKCDMNDKRMVSREKGDGVSGYWVCVSKRGVRVRREGECG